MQISSSPLRFGLSSSALRRNCGGFTRLQLLSTNCSFPELVNSDVILTNASEVHGHCVAQHVIALIFAAARRIDVDIRYQQKRYWGQEDLWRQRPRPRNRRRNARFSRHWGDWS